MENNSNEDSILGSVKSSLGIDETETGFDNDIIICINTVFGILNQLGIGTDDVFSINDKTTKWSEFIGNTNKYSMAKTYMNNRVRLMFDPPSTQNLIDAMNASISELESRMMLFSECKNEEVNMDGD